MVPAKIIANAGGKSEKATESRYEQNVLTHQSQTLASASRAFIRPGHDVFFLHLGSSAPTHHFVNGAKTAFAHTLFVQSASAVTW